MKIDTFINNKIDNLEKLLSVSLDQNEKVNLIKKKTNSGDDIEALIYPQHFLYHNFYIRNSHRKNPIYWKVKVCLFEKLNDESGIKVCLLVGKWLVYWGKDSLVKVSYNFTYATDCFYIADVILIQEKEKLEEWMVNFAETCCKWNALMTYDKMNCNELDFVCHIVKKLNCADVLFNKAEPVSYYLSDLLMGDCFSPIIPINETLYYSAKGFDFNDNIMLHEEKDELQRLINNIVNENNKYLFVESEMDIINIINLILRRNRAMFGNYANVQPSIDVETRRLFVLLKQIGKRFWRDNKVNNKLNIKVENLLDFYISNFYDSQTIVRIKYQTGNCECFPLQKPQCNL
ncbi:hypothetical protein ABK040_001595 [Willaertia magna]